MTPMSAQTKSKLGDIYLLGDNRLMCGDSTNASAYIWGNARELWRLWYSKLSSSEQLTLRNEIVWDKSSSGSRMFKVANLKLYPPVTERCLFFMLGAFDSNNNADNYWEGWDFIVNYLKVQKKNKADCQ